MKHVEDKQSDRQQDADKDDVQAEVPRRPHLHFMWHIYILSSRMTYTRTQNETKHILHHVRSDCSMTARVLGFESGSRIMMSGTIWLAGDSNDHT